MNKSRILIVEEDVDVSKMLRIYFDSQGYEALVTHRFDDALNICRTRSLAVVLVGIPAPGVDDFLEGLRSNIHTEHIPIIHLTKPFDIEELKSWVENAIRRFRHDALTHPLTNLSAGKLIEIQLKKVKASAKPWILLHCSIRHINVFKEVAGPPTVSEVIMRLADIIRETVAIYGNEDDFIGQPDDNRFIIITNPDKAPKIRGVIIQRFNDQTGGEAELSWQ